VAAVGDSGEVLRDFPDEAEFRAVVEEITGRSVLAFISGIDTRSDRAGGTFMLEPADP
jgi:uncharacterized protein YbcI